MQVDLIDHMGSDLTVVNAARVSFRKHRTELSPADARLLRYLAAHNHFTPFTHPQITFRVKAPIFVARQCFKSKVGLTENEVSRRYVDDEPEIFEPPVWRRKAESRKQGSEGVAFVGRLPAYGIAVGACLEAYQSMLAIGVAPEQARMVLPQSMYTEWYWTGSLYAFMRFCSLRLAPDAQEETAYIARLISRELAVLYPAAWNALTLTQKEGGAEAPPQVASDGQDSV